MHQTLTNIADIGQAVAGFAAVIALLYAGRQLRQTRRLAREDKVISYFDRINTREFFDLMSQSRDKLVVPEGDREECWATFRAASRREQQEYFLVANILEGVATLYNDSLVDKKATSRLLGEVAVYYWQEVGWFMERYRQEVDPLAASEWLKMNADLQDPSPGVRARLRLGQPWRVDDMFGGL